MSLTKKDRKFIAAIGALSALAAARLSLTFNRRARLQQRVLYRLLRQMREEQTQTYRQMEALLSLHQQINLRAPLPPTRGYAISPDFACILYAQVQEQRPALVVEASSGLSTIITAYALQANGAGRVIAVDHEARFAEATRAQLARHDLEEVAEVIHAPLVPQFIRGVMWNWYDAAALDAFSSIDLLMVDGPPQWGNPQPMVRYPALPMLIDRLSDSARILVDDANRADERRAIKRWCEEYSIEIEQTFETEKGAVLLRRTSR